MPTPKLDVVVDSTRFKQTFELKATPLRDAIRKGVAWVREHPQPAGD